MSNELKQFYQEIWKWIQDGCPEHPVFITNVGLCNNLAAWSNYNKSLYHEQKELLIRRHGTSAYPFNTEVTNYAGECAWDEIYTNPKRLAFIEEHAK